MSATQNVVENQILISDELLHENLPHFYNTISAGLKPTNHDSAGKLIKNSDIKVQFSEKALTGTKLRVNNYIEAIQVE